MPVLQADSTTRCWVKQWSGSEAHTLTPLEGVHTLHEQEAPVSRPPQHLEEEESSGRA
eukprot:CAMPEP_0119317048 /NCGR_PEP_ID=MMETSP1333-20130426/41767_1 /TAXON_ID=418940 /ORGANISM="Scyphosphaera apsteinii, Strain RCC1455" /LENGTH=57 /DNA_ID=CAMNT_0007322865 /DNA_START=442 /DNA_END=615 /DNA_ORIENTATION=+